MRKDTASKKTPRDLDEAPTVECPTCHDVFLHKRSLERHQTVEHGPKVFYWCGQCEHRNNRRDNLRAHYRDCHSKAMAEVDHIKAETYESREGVRRSRSEEPSRHRPKEKKSSSSGRSSDRSSVGRREKRKRDDADSGDKSSRKHTRSERAPATVSRAPEEQQEELPVDSSGHGDAPVSQDPEENTDTTTVNEVNDQKEEERPVEEISEPAVEMQIETSDPGAQGVAEITLSATPTRWEEEIAQPSGVQPIPEVSGGKPKGMLKMREQLQQESAEDDEGEGEAEENLPVSDTPFQLGRLLPGQLVRWRETRESYIYRSHDKIIRGETTREYDVVYLRPCTQPEEAKPPTRVGHLCRLIKVDGEQPGSPLADREVVEAMVGNVHAVTETTTREVFCEGEKLTKDKTKRVFECGFQAAVVINSKP